MNRREWMIQAGAASVATWAGVASAAPAEKPASKKKGATGGNADTIRKIRANWYYTWWSGGRNGTAAEFVPMIKNRKDLSSNWAFDEIGKLKGITHLLGYNEPERKDQGDIPLEDAIKAWPRLVKLAEEKNLKLGSPATSSDDGGMKYFHAFMEQAKSKKLRIDFIAMHWYRGRDAGDFSRFFDDLAKRYKLPIWITEFNGWNGDEADNYKFVKGALRYLERSSHIERYAYFEPGSGALSMFKKDGTLSRIGEAYHDV